jgi:hypothetical protein
MPTSSSPANTDNTGDATADNKLSLDRASSVRDQLLAAGIDAARRNRTADGVPAGSITTKERRMEPAPQTVGTVSKACADRRQADHCTKTSSM